MGQLDLTCRAPPLVGALHDAAPVEGQVAPLGVALQVAFERQTLKPVFSLDRL
jgi:hypothetical protein